MKTSLALIAALVFLTACGGDTSSGRGPLGGLLSDPLVGCYASEKGKAPIVKIAKKSGQYFGSLIGEMAGAMDKGTMLIATDEQKKELFKKEVSTIDKALIYSKGGFVFLKLKHGEPVEGKLPESDYMMIMPLGGGTLFVVNCT